MSHERAAHFMMIHGGEYETTEHGTMPIGDVLQVMEDYLNDHFQRELSDAKAIAAAPHSGHSPKEEQLLDLIKRAEEFYHHAFNCKVRFWKRNKKGEPMRGVTGDCSCGLDSLLSDIKNLKP